MGLAFNVLNIQNDMQCECRFGTPYNVNKIKHPFSERNWQNQKHAIQIIWLMFNVFALQKLSGCTKLQASRY